MFKKSKSVVFVTGLPQFTTRRLTRELVAKDQDSRFIFLVPERFHERALEFLATLPGRKDRYSILDGEVNRIDMGLSGQEYNRLAAKVTTIHHTAAVFHLGIARSVAEQMNVTGTEEIIEFARASKGLERLVFYSTLGVSGDFHGVWTEEDFERGQKFHNHYELTKFRAETLLRREKDLPLTILRSPVIVGDSVTGEIDKFDGPFQLMLLFIALPVDLGLPLPGRASRLINLIPVDYYAKAAQVLATHPDSLGKTLHITDPEPLTMAQVFELIAMASEKKVPSGYIPARLTRALMHTPGLERIADSPVAALDLFTADVVYSSSKAQEILREAGVVCPRFTDYVESLVGFLKQKIAQEREPEVDIDVFDPLW